MQNKYSLKITKNNDHSRQASYWVEAKIDRRLYSIGAIIRIDEECIDIAKKSVRRKSKEEKEKVNQLRVGQYQFISGNSDVVADTVKELKECLQSNVDNIVKCFIKTHKPYVDEDRAVMEQFVKGR